MITNEHLYAIALRECSNIGDANFRKLIQHFGSAEDTWNAKKQDLKKVHGFGDKIIKDIGDPTKLKFAEEEISFSQKNNIQIKLLHLQQYPELLSNCTDPPSIIYNKGNLPENRKYVSLVGTRNMTPYGKQFIKDFLIEIASQKIATVSGLAYGVDALVHQVSIEKNIPTIGVLAHGLHMIYPSKHYNLAQEILNKDGVLLSEFNSRQKPDREHFIQRNRIIAALSQTTIIVESAFGGGSMNTAQYANDYNRDVFALPGKITDTYSQGCNLLISQNKAEAIVSISDLLKRMDFDKTIQPNLFSDIETLPILNEEQKEIFDIIKTENIIAFDKILDDCTFSANKILAILLDLELLGYIDTLSGRRYQSKTK